VSVPASDQEMSADDEQDFKRLAKATTRVAEPYVLSRDVEISEVVKSPVPLGIQCDSRGRSLSCANSSSIKSTDTISGTGVDLLPLRQRPHHNDITLAASPTDIRGGSTWFVLSVRSPQPYLSAETRTATRDAVADRRRGHGHVTVTARRGRALVFPHRDALDHRVRLSTPR
jgi:hypothetical protein